MLVWLGVSPYWEGVMIVAGIAAIGALGLQLTIASGQFSVVHGALMGAASYFAGVSAVAWGLGFWPAVLAGAAFGALLGVAIAVIALRLDGLFLGIATLAIGQALALIAQNTSSLGSSNGYSGIPLRTQFGDVALVLVLALLALLALKRTRVGLALTAVGRDPIAARSLGISSTRIRLGAFAAGGLLAGAAGALNAQYVSFVSPGDLGFPAEVQLLLYVVLGGMTTPWGAVVGTFSVVVGTELLSFTALDRLWILGLVLMVVALTRPDGVLRRSSLPAPRRSSA